MGKINLLTGEMSGTTGGIVGQVYGGANVVRAGGWTRSKNSQAQIDALNGAGLLGTVYTVISQSCTFPVDVRQGSLSQRNFFTKMNSSFVLNWNVSGKGIIYPNDHGYMTDMTPTNWDSGEVTFKMTTEPAYKWDELDIVGSCWLFDLSSGKLIGRTKGSGYSEEWIVVLTDLPPGTNLLVFHGMVIPWKTQLPILWTFSLLTDPKWWT